MRRSNIALAATGVVAIISVAGGLLLISDRLKEPPLISIPNAEGPAPGVAWTLESDELMDNEAAVFVNPTIQGWGGEPSFLDAGDVLVTLAGLSNQGLLGFAQRTMVAIDTADGSVRWKSPAPKVERCAPQPIDGSLICFTTPYEDPELVAFDLDDGEVRRVRTDWTVLAIAAANDRLVTIEGNPEDRDLRMHSGTFDSPSSEWTVDVDLEAGWEDSFGRILRVSEDLGVVELGGETAGFDLTTGREAWRRSLPDCSESTRLVGSTAIRIMSDCGQGAVVGSEAITSTGHVLARSDRESAHRVTIDDGSGPILLGDKAFDPASGKHLWTSPDLVTTAMQPAPGRSFLNATAGSAVAINEGTAMLADVTGQTIGALDLDKGTLLWRRQVKSGFDVAAFLNGCAITQDVTDIRATDVRSGKALWKIPLSSLVASDSRSAPVELDVSGDRLVLSTDEKLIVLQAH